MPENDSPHDDVWSLGCSTVFLTLGGTAFLLLIYKSEIQFYWYFGILAALLASNFIILEALTVRLQEEPSNEEDEESELKRLELRKELTGSIFGSTMISSLVIAIAAVFFSRRYDVAGLLVAHSVLSMLAWWKVEPFWDTKIGAAKRSLQEQEKQRRREEEEEKERIREHKKTRLQEKLALTDIFLAFGFYEDAIQLIDELRPRYLDYSDWFCRDIIDRTENTIRERQRKTQRAGKKAPELVLLQQEFATGEAELRNVHENTRETVKSLARKQLERTDWGSVILVEEIKKLEKTLARLKDEDGRLRSVLADLCAKDAETRNEHLHYLQGVHERRQGLKRLAEWRGMDETKLRNDVTTFHRFLRDPDLLKAEEHCQNEKLILPQFTEFRYGRHRYQRAIKDLAHIRHIDLTEHNPKALDNFMSILEDNDEESLQEHETHLAKLSLASQAADKFEERQRREDKRIERLQGFDVFLSYNSNDKPAARQLKKHLVGRNLTVWLDEDELQPGVPWPRLLENGVRASRSVVVLIGKDGLGPWEIEEMEAALQLAVRDKRAVIPVLLPDAPGEVELPLFLGTRTWVDLRPEMTNQKLDRLVWGITNQKPNPR